MPKLTKEVRDLVVAKAKLEFLENGFEHTSMRNIASDVGISVAGLYKLFTNKEALFDEVVQPAMDEFNNYYESVKRDSIKRIDEDNLEAIYDTNSIENVLNMLYADFDAFKLIICCSTGTKYENFLDDIVVRELKDVNSFIQIAKEKKVPINTVKPEYMQILMRAYYGALFEVVRRDFTRSQAEQFLQTLIDFFEPGWREIFRV
ncbi:MAG: TetR/AcrR family transcriptional regulator [Lachnospira sp.]|nr:TetR/AcrR family transcriptional regulator [Lachnospira sp.]